MANYYVSSITGANNDNYNTRINNLSTQINDNYDWFNSFKLNKVDGDDIYENITLTSSNIAMNSTPSSDTIGNVGVRYTSNLYDLNKFGGIRPISLADSTKGLELWGMNNIYGGGGDRVSLKFGIKNDGTVVVIPSDEDVFSKGLYGYSYFSDTSRVGEIITINTSVVKEVTVFAVAKWGKFVQYTMHWTNKAAFNRSNSGNITNQRVGTINAGYRPRGDSYAVGCDGVGACWYSAKSDGVLELGAVEGYGNTNSIAVGTTFVLAAAYVCQ